MGDTAPMNPMRILIIITIVFFNYLQMFSQTFHRAYDTDPGYNQQATDIHVLDDGYLIIGYGNKDCVGDGGACRILMKTDFHGNVIWTKELLGVLGLSRRSSVIDSILYFSGFYFLPDGNWEKEGFRLFRCDLEGNYIDDTVYNTDSQDDLPVFSVWNYTPFGVVSYGDKIVMYGNLFEEESEEHDIQGQGLMVWYNLDMSLDTMIVIQPRGEYIDFHNAQVGPDGLLTILFDEQFDNPNNLPHGNLHDEYRRFEKYDLEGNKVWESERLDLINTRWRYIPSAILPNGDMITYDDNDSSNVASKELVCFGNNGTIKWRSRLDPNASVDFRNILDITISHDSNILIAGEYEDYYDERSGAYLAKYSSTGEFLWERVYCDWTELTSGNAPAFDVIWKVKVREDGGIVMVGFRKKQSNDFEEDIVLISLDSKGCVTPECGGFEQHVAGTPKYYHMFYEGSLWYLQDPSAENGVYRIQPANAFGMEDGTIFYSTQLDKFIDPTVQFAGEIRNTFKLKDDGREVYVIQDTDTLLVYDFKLNIGDTFSSDYLEHDLEVIDSDSISLLNGDRRRTWTLSSPDYPENTLRWIEGVGSDYGILWPKDFPKGNYGEIRLSCYYMWERLQYINPDVGGCLISSTTDQKESEDPDSNLSYPNPAIDELYIKDEAARNLSKYQIYDIHGQILFEGSTLNQVIDISFLESGIYLLELSYQEEIHVQKFIKISH